MTIDSKTYGLISGFYNSLEAKPDQCAIEFSDGTKYTYNEMGQIVLYLSEKINFSKRQNVGVLADKSLFNYAGPLACLYTQKTFVPLNAFHPVKKHLSIIADAGIDLIIVGREVEPNILDELSSQIPITFIREEEHNLTLVSDYTEDFLPPVIPNNYPAYIIFTSGSTGSPKGVIITNENISHFLSFMRATFSIAVGERFSQIPDSTFDLSMMDIYLCWQCCGTLIPVPKHQVLAPLIFVKEKMITVWVSVPSAINIMSKLKMLTGNVLPTIKHSFFCGEAFRFNQYEAWRNACPQSQIINFYGPTEAACAITYFDCEKLTEENCPQGVVPIGIAFSNNQVILLDGDDKITEELGELALTGSQVSPGYLNNKEQNEQKFAIIPELHLRIYKTGDLARKDKTNVLHFLGRKDFQVKLNGYRLELQEIEAVLTKITGLQSMVLGFPRNRTTIETIVGVIQSSTALETDRILKSCENYLPKYMVPRELVFLETFPTNFNGKTDRNEIFSMLEKLNAKF